MEKNEKVEKIEKEIDSVKEEIVEKKEDLNNTIKSNELSGEPLIRQVNRLEREIYKLELHMYTLSQKLNKLYPDQKTEQKSEQPEKLENPEPEKSIEKKTKKSIWGLDFLNEK